MFRVAEHREDGNDHAFVVRIDLEHAAFEGHFPGRPVLPAIGQIALLDALLARCDPGHRGIVTLGRVRFENPVGPGDALAVDLRLEGDDVRFALHRDGRTVARGSLARLREGA